MTNDHQVTVSRVLKARKWQIMRLLTHVEDFPRYMPNVKECSILKKGRAGAFTCWRIEIEKIPLSWKEQDEFDFKAGEIRFKALEGDLAEFEGVWRLEDQPQDSTKVTLEVKFRIGLPMIENLIGNLFGAKLRHNCDLMLAAIEDRLVMGRYKRIRHRSVSDLSGFVVIGHPYNYQHLIRYFRHFKPDLKLPSQEFIVKLFDLTPAYKAYDIKGFRAKSGRMVNGYFVVCPIIPDMLALSPQRVVEKVCEACRVAEGLGVGIVTLGGFTSIAGERFGGDLLKGVNVPVTTGNTFTVALTMDGILKAAEVMDLDLASAKAVVIGGGGDIGGTVARILADYVSELTITGRDEKNLMERERILSYSGKARVYTSTDNNRAIRGADLVVAAASTSASIIDFNAFKPGAIVCDVGYPKNISYTECQRRDILIFSGGITCLPSRFDLGFDIGMPSPDVLYGCFAEAILLDLEERYENFSWGKGNISKEKVNFIREVGKRHGFELAPFFWGDRLLTDKDLENIKVQSKAALLKSAR